MTPREKTLLKLRDLFAKARATAEPPYKRHSAKRLERVHAIHGEVLAVIRAAVEKEREVEAIYRGEENP